MDHVTWTIGIEEEYQIIDPTSRDLSPSIDIILPKAAQHLGENVKTELLLSQIEVATPICQTLADVRFALARLRREVISSAASVEKNIAAAGTHPFSHWQQQPITPKVRYWELERLLQQVIRDHALFGCHIHIGIKDREVAIGIMNHVSVWIATLLALSANSPFWEGNDTGYASFRTLRWWRWPFAGLPQQFGSLAEYERVIEMLIATNMTKDATTIHWDVRLSGRFETIEIRTPDVCMTIDEAVMISGLTRALIQSCYEQVVQQEPYQVVRQEFLRAALWYAARYGVSEELIDLRTMHCVSAEEMVKNMLTFVRPALERNNEWTEVSSIVDKVLREGNGAMRQRKAYERRGKMEDVVDFIVSETQQGIVV